MAGENTSEVEVSMLDYDSPQEKEPTDYTGLKTGAILVPVSLLFVFLGHADRGLTVCFALTVIMLAIKIR